MFVTSDRAVLAVNVADARCDAREDVLLLHAGVTDQRSWHALVQRLSLRRRCITFDERGFGATTYEPEDGWSPVQDAVRVLHALDVAQCVVIGSSSGGQTAVDLALAHPDRVSALVLIAPAVRGAPYPSPTTRETQLEEDAERAQQAGRLDEANELEAQLWLDGPTSRPGRVAGPARELFLEMNRKALSSPPRGPTAKPEDAWPRLSHVTVPTRVLVGDLDVSDLQVISGQLASELQSAELIELPGVA